MTVYEILNEKGRVAVIVDSLTEQEIQDNYPGKAYRKKATHKTEFSPKDLYDSFTTDEALLALMSSSPAVVAQAQLLTVNRGVTISASEAGYQSAIDLLETEGVLTADRAADYRNGIPI
jgi:hypothetical protein